MEKKEFKDFIKQKFNSMGFKQKNSGWYKFIEDDYVIGFDIDPSYGKSYQCTCGCIYLTEAQRNNFQFNACYDWRYVFKFPRNPQCELDIHFYEQANENIYNNIKEATAAREAMGIYFEYEKFSLEQLEEYFNANYEFYFTPLFDKNHALNKLKNDIRLLGLYKHDKFVMFCELFGYDEEKLILEINEKRRISQKKFLEDQVTKNGLTNNQRTVL